MTNTGNKFGYLCPNCDKGTEILVTANAEVLLTPTGTDIDTSTTPVWNSTSSADCLNCGWVGSVGDLVHVVMGKEPTSERVDESKKRESAA